MTQQLDVFAYFEGGPGGPKDMHCRSIFESIKGAISIGAGTDLTTNVRDVQYRVPAAEAPQLEQRLKLAGFRTEVRAP